MRFAIPRNDPRVAVLVTALDRDDVSMAETWRRVGDAGERLGLRRPSYGHVRRLVRVERRRRDVRAGVRDELEGVLTSFAAGRVPSAVWTLQRLRELELASELVLQEHKAFERRE